MSIKFEFHKLIKNKSIKIFFIVLLSVNTLLSCYFCGVDHDKTNAGYSKDIQTLITQTEKKLSMLNNEGAEGFTNEYFEQLIEKYNTVLKTVTQGQKVQGWGQFFKYNASYLFAMFFCSLCAIYSFRSEKHFDLFSVVYSSKNGRGRYIASKILWLLFVSLITVIFFQFSSIVGIIIKNGFSAFSGANEYLQSLSGFVYCPIPLPIWQILLLSTVYCTLIIFAISLFVGVVSYLFNSNLLPFFTFALSVGGMYYLSVKQYLNSNSIPQHCNWISALNLSDVLKEYRCINLNGFAVPVYCANLFMAFAGIMLLSAVILFFHNQKINIPLQKLFKTEFFKKLKSSKPNIKEYNPNIKNSLYFFEIKKIQTNKIIIFCLLLLIVIKTAVSFYPLFIERSYKDKIYQTYCERWEGFATEEKLSEITAEEQFINNSIDNYLFYQYLMNRSGEIDMDIEQVENDYRYAQMHLEPFEQFSEKYAHIQDTDSAVFYDTGYLELWSNGADLLLFVAVLCLCTFVFSNDTLCLDIQRSTLKGRDRLFNTKLKITLVSTAILFLLFTLINDVPVIINYDFPNSDYLINGIKGYYIPIPIGIYTVLVRVISFVSYMSLALLTSCITSIAKQQIPALMGISAFFLLPSVLNTVSANESYMPFDLFSALNGNNLILNILNYGKWYFALMFAVIFVLPVALLLLSRHRYNRSFYKRRSNRK